MPFTVLDETTSKGGGFTVLDEEPQVSPELEAARLKTKQAGEAAARELSKAELYGNLAEATGNLNPIIGIPNAIMAVEKRLGLVPFEQRPIPSQPAIHFQTEGTPPLQGSLNVPVKYPRVDNKITQALQGATGATLGLAEMATDPNLIVLGPAASAGGLGLKVAQVGIPALMAQNIGQLGIPQGEAAANVEAQIASGEQPDYREFIQSLIEGGAEAAFMGGPAARGVISAIPKPVPQVGMTPEQALANRRAVNITAPGTVRPQEQPAFIPPTPEQPSLLYQLPSQVSALHQGERPVMFVGETPAASALEVPTREPTVSGKLGFRRGAVETASTVPERTRLALEAEKQIESDLANILAEAERTKEREGQLSDIAMRQLELRIGEQAQKALRARQQFGGLYETVEPGGFTAIDNLVARARLLGENVAEQVNIIKQSAYSKKPIGSETLGKVSFGAEAPTLGGVPLPARTQAALEAEKRAESELAQPKPTPPAVNQPLPAEEVTTVPAQPTPPAVEAKGAMEVYAVEKVPATENGGRIAIIMPDGSAIVGGRIHADTWNKAVEQGIATDSDLSNGVAGFVKPDGTAWGVNGKPLNKVSMVYIVGNEIPKPAELPKQRPAEPVLGKEVTEHGKEMQGKEAVAPPQPQPAVEPAKPAAVPSPPSAAVKEPWEMTQADFVKKHKAIDAAWQRDKSKPSISTFGKFYGNDYQTYLDAGKYGGEVNDLTYEQQKHKSEVKQALREGKPVPAEVLKDYPDLQQKPQAASEAVTEESRKLVSREKKVSDFMSASQMEELKSERTLWQDYQDKIDRLEKKKSTTSGYERLKTEQQIRNFKRLQQRSAKRIDQIGQAAKNAYEDYVASENNLPGQTQETLERSGTALKPQPPQPKGEPNAESLRTSERQPSETGQAVEASQANRGGVVEQTPPQQPQPVEPGKPANVQGEVAKKPFEVDEQVIMRSPHTGEDTIVSYRGKPSEGQAVVWSGKSQFQVPESWLRHQGEKYEQSNKPAKQVNPILEAPKSYPVGEVRKPMGDVGGRKTSTYNGYEIESVPQAMQVGYSTNTKLFGKGRRIGGFIVTDTEGYQRHFNTLKQAKQWIDNNPISKQTTTAEKVDVATRLANGLENLKFKEPGRGELQMNIFGVPAYVWNGAVNAAQAVVRAGGKINQAIHAAIRFIKQNFRATMNEPRIRSALERSMREFETDTPLPDYQDHQISKALFSEPFGMERLPVIGKAFGGMRRLAGELNSAIVTYWNERQVGRSVASALAQQYSWLNRAFKVGADGKITNITPRDPNASLYISDVFEGLQRDPSSYQLSPEQRRAFAAIRMLDNDFARLERKYRIGKNQDNENEAANEGMDVVDAPPSDEPYFTRIVTSRPTKTSGTAATTGNRVGSKVYFEKPRVFASEAEGWSKGYKYETDIARRLATRAERLYKRMADKRLIADPSLRARSKQQVLDDVKASYSDELASGTMTEAQVEHIAEVVAKRGMVNQPAFSGKVFDPETAEVLKKAFPENYQGWLRIGANINNALKALWLGMDLGVGFIQGQMLIAYNPKIWGKATVNSLRAMVSREFFPEYVRRNLEPVREMAQLGSSVGRMEEMMAGMERGELIHQIPGIKQTLGKAIVPFARQFQTFLDVAKVEMWKGLREVTPKSEWEQTIQSIESVLSSNIMERSVIGQRRILLERAALIAPSYYRGALNLMEGILRQGRTGDISRRAITSYLIAGSLIFYIVGKGLGMTEEELSDRMNPARSDFMLWKVKTGDRTTEFGFGGVYKSIAKLLGNIVRTSIENPGNWGSLSSEKNPFVRWIRSHAGPVPSLLWDQFSGKNFMGKSVNLSDLLQIPFPMAARTALGFKTSAPFNPMETGATFMGLSSFEKPNQNITEANRIAMNFLRTSDNPKYVRMYQARRESQFPDSQYKTLLEHLGRMDMERAGAEYQKMIASGISRMDILQYFKNYFGSETNPFGVPFTGSVESELKFNRNLSPRDKAIVGMAREERKNLARAFFKVARENRPK